MPSPFPGMNPYLENSELWTEVHHRLISAIAIAIAPVSLKPEKYAYSLHVMGLAPTMLKGIIPPNPRFWVQN